jgi:hypothetical protein
MYNHAVLCGPAPSRPDGLKSPGNVNPCEIVSSAVNRYPMARMSKGADCKKLKWPSSKTAVIRSLTTSS